jgi:hypothetical protein
MSIQRFSLAAIQQIRQHIQKTLVTAAEQTQLWVGLEETDDAPAPTSIDDLSSIFAFGGLSAEEIIAPQAQAHWSLSTVNPASALLKLPGVTLKPDWRLVSYLYQEGSSSTGLVFALPELLATTARLEKARAASSSIKQPPQPEGALTDFMEAIEGDRSMVSFIVASLLCRELREFGAQGHYQSWTHHRLIDAVPPQVKWQWQSELPKDLTPKVKLMPDGQAIVEFFSCRVTAGIALYRHVDQYPVAQYKLKRLDKPLAKVQR